jgi:hypothetical protein
MESTQEFDRVRTEARADQHDGARTGTPLIDIVRALDLLAAAVEQRGESFVFVAGRHQLCLYRADGGPQCLVGRCLSLAGVGDDELDALGGDAVRDLYRRGALPARLTLGALVVFDAAQRGQDRAYSWGDALDYAVGVAERFLGLIPPSITSTGHPTERDAFNPATDIDLSRQDLDMIEAILTHAARVTGAAPEGM